MKQCLYNSLLSIAILFSGHILQDSPFINMSRRTNLKSISERFCHQKCNLFNKTCELVRFTQADVYILVHHKNKDFTFNFTNNSSFSLSLKTLVKFLTSELLKSSDMNRSGIILLKRHCASMIYCMAHFNHQLLMST